MFINKIYEYIKYGKKQSGLIDQTDDNNFGSRAVFTPTKKDVEEALKKPFIVFNPKLLDQLDNWHCVGFGGAYEAEATEDFDGESKQGSGSYVFAMAKKWSGASIHTFGTSLLAGAMARVKYGICSKELFDYKKGMNMWFSNWRNIPDNAIIDGAKHKAGSAWELNVPWGMTKFDAIVATMYHFRKKKVLIGTGNKRHRITVIGYDKGRKCLICKDTYGMRTFFRGTRYINRIEARTLFTPYFVLDIERTLAEILVKYDRKVVKLKDDKNCYLVKNGELHSLVDEKVAWSHGFLLAPYDGHKLTEIIEKEDMDKIPVGKPLEYADGKNVWIINRIIEKYNIK